MTSQNPPDDDPLVDELRRLFGRDDPVPPLVTDIAKASLGWRRLDGELAELLADSLDVEAFALTRGSAAVRAVSFAARELTIDIELHGTPPELRLLGQLSPPSQTQIQVQTAGVAEPALVRSDQLGRFRTALTAGSSIRLRVAVGDSDSDSDGDEPIWIETSWITV